MPTIIRLGTAAAVALAVVFAPRLSLAQGNQASPYDRVGQRPATGPSPTGRAPAQGQPGNAPQATAAPGQNVPPRYQRPPEPQPPFRISREHEAFLNKVLLHWENESKKVRLFEAKFVRYEYDPIWGPPDPLQPKTESDGELKYADPDKGMFRIVETRHYTRPAKPGEQPTYQKKEGEVGEHWVCDGQSIWEYNAAKKQLVEHQLPPEMRGRAIANGPLPFLFGAKADELKRRYWMRVITPQDVQDKQLWLEAYPKFQQDAANFLRVEFILDLQSFLPVGIQVHSPNNKSRMVYSFYETKVNDRLAFLKKDFSQPDLPRGWQKVVEPPPGAARAEAVRQARRPDADLYYDSRRDGRQIAPPGNAQSPPASDTYFDPRRDGAPGAREPAR